jgi:hypothetical protein
MNPGRFIFGLCDSIDVDPFQRRSISFDKGMSNISGDLVLNPETMVGGTIG